MKHQLTKEINVKHCFRLLPILAFCAGAQFAFAQPPAVSDWPTIKIELESMFKSDQALRNEFNTMQVEARAKGVEVEKSARDALWARINEQDGINQKRLAEIVEKNGWPKKSDVGSLGATAAFLIVQHAPLDYQLKNIDHLREAAMAGEAAKSDVALLEDRVLIRQGKPQRFGLQVDTKRGVSILPTEDEANLDARRKTMDLGPICEYLVKFVKASGNINYAPCIKKVVAP